jgi:hypothetical protein
MSGKYSKFGMWWLKMSDFVFMITVVVNGVGLMHYLKKREGEMKIIIFLCLRRERKTREMKIKEKCISSILDERLSLLF